MRCAVFDDVHNYVVLQTVLTPFSLCQTDSSSTVTGPFLPSITCTTQSTTTTPPLPPFRSRSMTPIQSQRCMSSLWMLTTRSSGAVYTGATLRDATKSTPKARTSRLIDEHTQVTMTCTRFVGSCIAGAVNFGLIPACKVVDGHRTSSTADTRNFCSVQFVVSLRHP